MSGFIEPERWKSFLDDFSKRNQMRATRLEIVGEMGAGEEEDYLPFIGVSLDPKGSATGDVEILLGRETVKDPRRVEHVVPKPVRIALLVGSDGLENGVGFEDADGNKTILTFEKLLEIPETTSNH